MKNGKHNIKFGKVIGNRKKCRPSRAKSALEREKALKFPAQPPQLFEPVLESEIDTLTEALQAETQPIAI